MILGVGIDVLSLSRFKYYSESVPGFLVRLFPPNELNLNLSQLAGNFSAREALFKAYPVMFQDSKISVEILREKSGRPYSIVRVKNQQTKSPIVHLSLTNLRDLVIAVAILESNEV